MILTVVTEEGIVSCVWMEVFFAVAAECGILGSEDRELVFSRKNTRADCFLRAGTFEGLGEVHLLNEFLVNR